MTKMMMKGVVLLLEFSVSLLIGSVTVVVASRRVLEMRIVVDTTLPMFCDLSSSFYSFHATAAQRWHDDKSLFLFLLLLVG